VALIRLEGLVPELRQLNLRILLAWNSIRLEFALERAKLTMVTTHCLSRGSFIASKVYNSVTAD